METRRPTRIDQPLKRILSWTDITRAVDHLVSRLSGDYDAMLVITRGGMVPACLISERLDIRDILVAAVRLYTGFSTTQAEPTLLQFPADDLLRDKSILIVDDVWDSGRTAVAVRERVRSAGGRPQLAVLHFKPRASQFPDDGPDYFAEMTDDWIVYPWDEA